MPELVKESHVSRIVLEGFKSIGECDLELGKLNILIGCNGAGKSNFISLWSMTQQLLNHNLQIFVSRQGGPDALLHFGRKTTEQLGFKFYFGDKGYFVKLEPTLDNRLMFASEAFWSDEDGELQIGRGHFETNTNQAVATEINSYVLESIQQWRVYHFRPLAKVFCAIILSF